VAPSVNSLMSGGSHYEITIDGVGRTNRDTKEIAIEAAKVLKADNPSAKVVVRDRETGEMIETATILPMIPKPAR
jgi:hypothetical protein